ncbi:MAG: T9SS type A sorting domain-containing protein [candidate division Zixibacteria bacterium]|nr:T9SS type A sorting domain-containing protein [candidate division Zixibacteria bacterium]
MRAVLKYFLQVALIFILLLLSIHFTGSQNIFAGKSQSELSLKSSAGGEVIIDDFLVNDDISSIDKQIKPAITCNHKGDIVVTWTDFREDALGDIYAVRFNPSGVSVDTNFKVNSDVTVAGQCNPKVGMDSSGVFVIVWEDGRFGHSDIYAQRYSASGALLGSNFRVNDDTGDAGQYFPDIALSVSGSLIIVWTDYRNGDADIYAQRYDFSGNPSGDNFKVNDDTGVISQEEPAILMDSYGNFIIVWQDYRNRDWDIYAQSYDSSGLAVGYNFRINQDTEKSFQKSPAISSDLSGNFIIAWRDDRNGNSDIYAQRFDFTGLPLGSDFKVNDDAGNTYQGFPEISSDIFSNFIITWTDYRNGNRDIYAQRYCCSGSAVGTNFRINDDTGTAFQEFPDISIDGSGNFILTWQDLRNGNYDIFFQRFESNGTPVESNFMINDDQRISVQLYPVIAVDDYGNFTLAWQDYRKGDWDIYVQRFKYSGYGSGSNFRVNDDSGTAYQKYPSIALNDYGNIILTWQDYRSGNWEIYAQRFDSSGNPSGPNFRIDSLGGVSPVVAADGAGNFVITWSDGRVNARRFDISGIPIDTIFRISGYGGSNPDIDVDNLGNFIIVWEDYRNDRYRPDIYARRYDSQAIPLDSSFKVNDDIGITYQGDPAISMDNSGNFIITWRDERNGNYDIYAQRYESSGSPAGSNFRVNDDYGNHYQWSPRVDVTGSGDLVITWHDYRSGNPDIYAQRYNSSGVPLGSNYLVNNPHFASFDQTNSAIASSGSNLYFTWVDNRKGNWDIYAKVVDWSYTEAEEEQIAGLPNYFELFQNYPNPFNPSTKIQFKVGSLKFGEPTHTTLIIYNILGQKVRTLLDEEMTPGAHQVVWDGRNEKGEVVSSGIYFYRLKAGEFTQTKRMVFVK